MTQFPPKNISAEELWARINEMPRPHKLVDFPRKDSDGKCIGQIAMVALTSEESVIVAANSERYARKILKENSGDMPKSDEMAEGYKTVYENRSSAEILFKACRKAEDLSKAFFPSVDDISRKLTIDEVGVLMRQYLYVQMETGPIISAMGNEEYEAWIERLGEGGSKYPLGFLSLGAQTTLILLMALELHNLRTANSSVS